MRSRLVILGAVGNCLDIVDAARAGDFFDPVGFLDDDPGKHGSTVYGLPVLGPLSQARELEGAFFVNGIGSPRTFRQKERFLAGTGIPRERFATVIHPAAAVSPSAQLGLGVVLLANVAIGAQVRVGDHVMMLQGCVVGHDTVIGNCVTMAAGVLISGVVDVGASCYLGAGSVLRDGVRLGEGSLLGAGAVQVRDLPPGGTYAGVPARELRR